MSELKSKECPRWTRSAPHESGGMGVCNFQSADRIILHTMTASGLDEKNRRFYDTLWSKTYLTNPRRFNTWPLVSSLVASSPMRLEVGAGMRPRLPIAGTHFIDASPPAVERLNARGGIA